MFEIAYLQYKDIENLINMNIEDEYAYDKELIEYLTKEKNILFTIIKNIKEDIIGLITTYLDKNKKTIFIKDIIVDINFRRKGIGSKLLKEYKRKVNGLSIKRLIIDIDEYNLSAQMFLKKNNFLFIETLSEQSVKYFYNEIEKKVTYNKCDIYRMVYTL